MAFGEHTTAVGVNTFETFIIEEPITKNLMRITCLGATVDKDKQVHEEKERNNQKVNLGGFGCVK